MEADMDPALGRAAEHPRLPDQSSDSQITQEPLKQAEAHKPKPPLSRSARKQLVACTLLLAALAIVSACLSGLAGRDPWNLFEFNRRFISYEKPSFFAPDNIPLLPAIYFGLVLCTGVYLWESKRIRDLAITFASVLVAWMCAYELAVRLSQHLNTTFELAICGVAGGFVGSLLTAFGVCLVSKDVRTRAFLVRTVLIGTIAGSLLQGVLFLGLYLVWQPTVAASIAYGICKPKLRRTGMNALQTLRRHEAAVLVLALVIVVCIGLIFDLLAANQNWQSAAEKDRATATSVAGTRKLAAEGATKARMASISAQKASARAQEAAARARSGAPGHYAGPSGTGRYEGEATTTGNGKMTWNGVGVCVFNDGGRIEGEFASGKTNGRVVHIFADGSRYEGDERNGIKQGYGVQIWPNGDRYEGELREDNREGEGVYTFGSGDIAVRYEGQWQKNVKEGAGILTMKDGAIQAGTFQNDKLVKPF